MYSFRVTPEERAQESVIVTSLDGTIVEWNAGAERVYGYTRAEALGLNVRQLYAGEADRFGELMERALASGQASFEKAALRVDGAQIRVSGSISIIRDQAGEATAVVGVTRDVTEAAQLLGQLADGERALTLDESGDEARTLPERCACAAIDSARALAREEGDEVDESLVLLMLKGSGPPVTSAAYGRRDQPEGAGIAFAIELLARAKIVLNALGKDIEIVTMHGGRGDGVM